MVWQELLASNLLDQGATRHQLAGHKRHYVYVLCRLDGTPFYVGKGVAGRCFNHEAEARNTERLTHKLNVLRAMHRRGEAVRYSIESSFEVEAHALARERELIELFGRHDLGLGPLTNQTAGGEGCSDPSEESRERRRQSLWGDEASSDERRVANRFFQKLCSVKSVPIKPAPPFRPEKLYANRSSFAMSVRQAAALAASSIANRVLLVEGALIPRWLHVEGTAMAIENGVGRDILSSGMANLDESGTDKESFELTAQGFRFLVDALDEALLLDAGILLPDSE